MRLPIKPICPKKKARAKDGLSKIHLQYCYSATNRTLLDTGIVIPPEYWDSHPKRLCVKNDLPMQYGEAKALNDELTRLSRLLEDLIKFAKEQNVAQIGYFVKEKFSPRLNLDAIAQNEFHLSTTFVPKILLKKTDFFQQLDDYIDSRENKVKDSTITVLHSMVMHFEAFEKYRGKPITFGSLDYAFYEDFIDFLTYEYKLPRSKKDLYGLKVNTIGKTIKQFRIFIRNRIRRKAIPFIDIGDWKIPEEETDSVYLSHEEIAQIYYTDLSQYPELIPYKNLFVLGCLTGLRFSDYAHLHPEDLRKNRLYKKQEKTGHWVIIPLRKEAKEIFTEQFKDEIPIISNVLFNKNIKKVAKLAGLTQIIKFSYKRGNKRIEVKKLKYNWITSHTARRSFCTNEFLAGTPVYLIMKISGHKTEKSFYRYIRISAQEAADRIQMLWEERQGMKAFEREGKIAC